jgi:alkylhydroperoxidase family enzyme
VRGRIDVSRLPTPPKREDLAKSERDAYDKVLARARAMAEPDLPGPSDYYGALSNSPELALALAEVGRLLRTIGDVEGGYGHVDREFGNMALCAMGGGNDVLIRHIGDALAVGVRFEAIEALRQQKEDALTADERRLAAYIRQVVSGGVTDDAYAALELQLGTRGVVEYTVFIAFAWMSALVAKALNVPELPDADIEQALLDYRDGRRPFGDYRSRLV